MYTHKLGFDTHVHYRITSAYRFNPGWDALTGGSLTRMFPRSCSPCILNRGIIVHLSSFYPYYIINSDFILSLSASDLTGPVCRVLHFGGIFPNTSSGVIATSFEVHIPFYFRVWACDTYGDNLWEFLHFPLCFLWTWGRLISFGLSF